jgi:uridine kinase
MKQLVVNNSERLATYLKELTKNKKTLVVAIDGQSGTGKSTVSRQLADELDAVVIEQDDFYTGGSLEDWAKKGSQTKAGEVMDWKRVREEALIPLIEGRAAKWHPFNWENFPDIGKKELSHETITCQPKDTIILDGAYSSRPELQDIIDVSVLVQW